MRKAHAHAANELEQVREAEAAAQAAALDELRAAHDEALEYVMWLIDRKKKRKKSTIVDIYVFLYVLFIFPHV